MVVLAAVVVGVVVGKDGREVGLVVVVGGGAVVVDVVVEGMGVVYSVGSGAHLQDKRESQTVIM